MQFQLSTLVGLLAIFTTANAVTLCSDFDPATGGCVGTCTDFDISLHQAIFDVPATNCIFNTVDNPGFDLQICSGTELEVPCSDLAQQPRVTITGDFNWFTPNTHSILRTGN